jgi:sulfide dehydrogenase cytochrome subunit
LAEKLGCQRCHGPNGTSIDANTPNLAGQKREYLRKQLQNFRRSGPKIINGELFSIRRHPKMEMISVILSDKNITSLVTYYSRLPCTLPKEKKIVSPPSEVDICETCHGGQRTTPFNHVPILAGQKEAYLKKAYLDYAASAKNNGKDAIRYHRLSSMIAARIPENFAKYYSQLQCR